MVVHAAWPQPQMMSGRSEFPSQNVLQNLLSAAGGQLHEGCAQVSLVLSAVFSAMVASARFASVFRAKACYKALLHLW